MSDDPLDPVRSDLSEDALTRGAARMTEAAMTRRMAWMLSLAGYVPIAFLALALLVIDRDNPLRPIAVDSLMTYGAIILSFLGGIRWGLAMKAHDTAKGRQNFIFSILPPLIGWFSLLLPLPYVFAVQALAFAAQGAWDSFAGQHGIFGLWFVRLRTWLTFLVVAALVIGFYGTV